MYAPRLSAFYLELWLEFEKELVQSLACSTRASPNVFSVQVSVVCCRHPAACATVGLYPVMTFIYLLNDAAMFALAADALPSVKMLTDRRTDGRASATGRADTLRIKTRPQARRVAPTSYRKDDDVKKIQILADWNESKYATLHNRHYTDVCQHRRVVYDDLAG